MGIRKVDPAWKLKCTKAARVLLICNQINLLLSYLYVKSELEEQQVHKVVPVMSIKFSLVLLVSLQTSFCHHLFNILLFYSFHFLKGVIIPLRMKNQFINYNFVNWPKFTTMYTMCTALIYMFL